MTLLEALHLRRSEQATLGPAGHHQDLDPSGRTTPEPPRSTATPSPLMASTSSMPIASPSSTVRAHGVDFELLPNSPPSRPNGIVRKLSKKRLRASTNPDQKRTHSLLPSLASRERSDSCSRLQASIQESSGPAPERSTHHRARPARPPLLRRASSDPDLQAMPTSFLSSRRPSAPAVHFTAPSQATSQQHHDPPVLASTPPRHFRRSRTPTQPNRQTSSPMDGSDSVTTSPIQQLTQSSSTTPKQVPPRIASRPAHLSLQNALASPHKTAISSPTSNNPSRHASSNLSVQVLGGQNQKQSAEVDMSGGDGATLVIDCNEPLHVEYKTVAVPGSSAKRWVLHFRKGTPESMPLSPPDSGSKAGRISPLSKASPSPSRPVAVQDLFYEPTTPTRSGTQRPAQATSPSVQGSDSPDGFGVDTDSDEASVVSSPQPQTPRPSIFATAGSPPIKQEGFSVHAISPDLRSPSVLQVQNDAGQPDLRPISPLQLNNPRRHVRISSTDTVLPLSPPESPGDEYYGDVLGIFLAHPAEEAEEEPEPAPRRPKQQLSLAERRGLKDPDFKLGLDKNDAAEEEVSRWSETESDDNDF